MKYKVVYTGWYIIEADSIDEAMGTSRDDFEVEYEEWENVRCYSAEREV